MKQVGRGRMQGACVKRSVKADVARDPQSTDLHAYASTAFLQKYLKQPASAISQGSAQPTALTCA